jgi:hypothetical protein
MNPVDERDSSEVQKSIPELPELKEEKIMNPAIFVKIHQKLHTS